MDRCITLKGTEYRIVVKLVTGSFFITYCVYIFVLFPMYYMTLILFCSYLHCKWSVGPYAF